MAMNLTNSVALFLLMLAPMSDYVLCVDWHGSNPNDGLAPDSTLITAENVSTADVYMWMSSTMLMLRLY